MPGRVAAIFPSYRPGRAPHQQEFAMITPTLRDQEEYRALRETIRERGTARMWMVVVGLVAWAALTIATAAVAATPVATLVPLLALAAVFEAVYALHIGVERIGRYLQVFHESGDAGAPGWEHVAMAFGRPKGAVAPDPLFTALFLLATLFNVTPALLVQPIVQELVFVGGAHALFAVRIIAARTAAAKQRMVDLRRFEEIKGGGTAP
jgi:hypothetical protein